MGEEHAIRPRRKRATVRGNLLKLAAVFVVFAIIAFAARMINREPTLILPERMNPERDAARRSSPDNALYALRDAQSLLPNPPGELAGILSDWAGRMQEHAWPRYTQELNRFIQFDAPQIVPYLGACAEALDAAHRAVRKPYFLFDVPNYYSWLNTEEFHELALVLVLRGAYAGRVHTDAPESAMRLGDAIRLSRLLSAEDPDDLDARGIEDEALRQIILCTEWIQDPAGLETLQKELETLGPPWPDPYRVLEQYWRQIDNTLALPLEEDGDQRGNPLRRMFFLREVQRWASSVIPHKEFFRELSAAPIAAQDRMIKEYGAIETGWRARRFQPMGRNPEILRKAAFTTFYYQRAMLVLALERFRLAEGAHPESLAALTPAWLESLPADPVSGAPYVYRRDGEKYILYGVGTDGLDDGGDAERDMLMITP